MPIVAKLDELGKPAWIALMILAFWAAWPLGLAVLAFTIWSGRMGCWKGHQMSRWHGGGETRGMGGGMGSGIGSSMGTWWQPPSRSSGNRAFDDYRAETLRRLEDEQREFHDFLGRLRLAKDKAEFDQFMAERRNRPNPNQNPEQSPPQN